MSEQIFLDYIASRGISIKTAEQFKLGYCDKDLNFHSFQSQPYIIDLISSKFRDSVIVPIFDTYGKFLGFTARRLNPKEDETKYDFSVYKKSKYLFGLNYVWKDLLLKDSVFVVEGGFDMIAAWQYGYLNTVGILGTNLSEQQAILLSRFVSEVVLVFDNDQAGEIATFQATELLRSLGLKVRSLKLSKDPDEALRENKDCFKQTWSDQMIERLI